MERKKFFELILKFLNGQLGKTIYFCGDSVSVADVAYYSEVSTVLMMLDADIEEFPLLNTWFYKSMRETFPVLEMLD